MKIVQVEIIMSTLARAALLLLLTLAFVRLSAAPTGELASLRSKAERGNALAQYNLGLAYSQGRLTQPDPAEAFMWLTLASESGATGKALDSLLGQITDAQLVEGRHRLALYRTALAARVSAAANSHSGPQKLVSRGFTLEAPTASVDPSPPGPLTKSPEAVVPPITTSPADGSGLSELTQAKKNLQQTRADLSTATEELITLRANVARLEAAAAEAKATVSRLTAELAAARQPAAANQLPPPVIVTAKPLADAAASPRP